MIITCPNCQTKYQVTYEAIGSVGRKVQCASCQQSWQQRPPAPMVSPEPESDQLFEEIAEDALDEALQAEQREAAQQEAEERRARRLAERAQEPEKKKKTADAAELRKRQQAFSRRQTAMFSSLPMARMRRTARIVAGGLLACIVGLGFFGRVQIVERYPDLAGLYSAVGLGVNVVGLDLAQLQSSRSVAEGKEALAVSAQIVGMMSDPVAVPPVLVSLLDAEDRTVYEWIVSPRVRDLMAGERATFDTRLSLPPSEAVRVRLSFTNGRAARGSANEPNQAGPREDSAAPQHAPAVSSQPQIPAH
ncbi:zinc-ribbon domain-containing protein [Devosia sp. FJ2-5-3]|jgi:predicted Zn finger-like uncharacterized protein|uniref:DUF3426 domain-containing protein n=1 Tax=Devosia sp. FJ2-5-3 TaxID=2976680 RepID=UPI0023D85849|nr:zinc-ribbon domain-containing protein [Devosia sp. FJ2-5-3]WEJ58933.1 zinc-ribbon domain-containing protein [Devosia sp. FJ2-5-3]